MRTYLSLRGYDTQGVKVQWSVVVLLGALFARLFIFGYTMIFTRAGEVPSQQRQRCCFLFGYVGHYGYCQ